MVVLKSGSPLYSLPVVVRIPWVNKEKRGPSSSP